MTANVNKDLPSFTGSVLVLHVIVVCLDPQAMGRLSFTPSAGLSSNQCLVLIRWGIFTLFMCSVRATLKTLDPFFSRWLDSGWACGRLGGITFLSNTLPTKMFPSRPGVNSTNSIHLHTYLPTAFGPGTSSSTWQVSTVFGQTGFKTPESSAALNIPLDLVWSTLYNTFVRWRPPGGSSARCRAWGHIDIEATDPLIEGRPARYTGPTAKTALIWLMSHCLAVKLRLLLRLLAEANAMFQCVRCVFHRVVAG